MTTDSLALIWVQSFVILGLTLGACFVFRSPLVRQMLCRGVLICLVGLALIVPFIGKKVSPIAPVEVSPMAARIVRLTTDAPIEKPVSVVAKATQEPGVETFDDPVEDASTEALIIWLMGVVPLAVWHAVGGIRLAAVRRRSTACTSSRVLSIAEEVRRNLGVPRLQIRCHKGKASIYVAGLIKPTIYAGEEWLSMQSDHDLKAFLVHEAAHIARGDLLWVSMCRLVQMFFWPQPLVWCIFKPMERSAEELCDRHVVTSGVEPVMYADGLLRVAEGQPRVSLGLGLFSSRSVLSRRLEILVKGMNLHAVKMNRKSRFVWSMGLIAMFLCTAFVFATPQKVDRYRYLRVPVPQGIQVLKIYDSSGRLIQNGEATLVSIDGKKQGSYQIPIYNGRVSIDLSRYQGYHFWLAVTAKNCGLTYTRLWPTDKTISRIDLAERALLEGVVVDTNQKQIGGISVYANVFALRETLGSGERISFFYPGNVPEIKSHLTAMTDRSGRFKIDGLPKGYEVQLSTDDQRFAVPSMDERVHIDKNVVFVPRIALSRTATISGKVIWKGKPVEGVKVYGSGANGIGFMPVETTTDRNGHYQLNRLCAGPWFLRLLLTEEQRSKATAMWTAELPVIEGSNLKDVNIELIAGCKVMGQITDRTGRPLSGINVGMVSLNRDRRDRQFDNTMTDERGYYLFRASPGSQQIRVDLEGGPHRDFEAKNGETKILNFKLEGVYQSDQKVNTGKTYIEALSNQKKFEDRLKFVDQAMKTGPLISGTIVDQRGKPLDQPIVIFEGPQDDAVKLSLTPSPTGYFQMRLMPGKQFVYVQGYRAQGKMVMVVKGQDQTVKLVVNR